MEIERRWVLDWLPSYLSSLGDEIDTESYFVTINKDSFLRLRKSIINNEYVRYSSTIKSGHGLSRIEIENELTEDEFNHLVSGSKHFILTTGRHYKTDKYTLDIKRVCNDNCMFNDLYIAEVEYKNINDIHLYDTDDIHELLIREGLEVTDKQGFELKAIYDAMHRS